MRVGRRWPEYLRDVGEIGPGQDQGKEEVIEMLMFSGLETQSEINQLLDELFGSLDRASPEVAEVDVRLRPTSKKSRRAPTASLCLPFKVDSAGQPAPSFPASIASEPFSRGSFRLKLLQIGHMIYSNKAVWLCSWGLCGKDT